VIVATISLAALVAQAFGRFTYALILPSLQSDLGISYTLAGSLGTANLIAYLVGSAAVSWLATRMELTAIIRAGLVGCVGGLFLLWWTPNLFVLFSGMIVTGVAGAFIWIPGPGLAASLARPENRGLAIGLVGAGIGVGFVLAGVAVQAGDGPAWRTVYGWEALFGSAVLAGGLVVLRTASRARRSRPSLDAIRSVPAWKPLVISYAAFGLSMSLFVNFLVARLEEDAGFSPESAAVAFSALGVATIFGGPVFGPISDRVGRGATMAVGFATMAGSAFLALVTTQPWPVIAAAVFGMSFAGVPTVLAAHLADHVEERAFGSAFGLATLSFGAGQIVGPQLGGWIGDATGSFALAFVGSALAAFAGVLLSLRIPASN
jgi:MFS family permease